MVVACALAACAGPQVLAPEQGRATPELRATEWVASDGARLGLTAIVPDAPEAVIVALHGMNDYGEAFRRAGEWWAIRGLATYAYDQRGHGRTRGHGLWPGEAQMQADLAAFVALVRARHPGVPVFLLGESMGGALAMAAMGSDAPPPVDGLVLVAPAVWGWSNQPLANRLVLALTAHAVPGLTVTGQGLGRRPTDNAWVLERMGRDPYVLKSTRADAVHGLVSLMESAWAAAPRIAAPVLVLFAPGDQIIPGSAMRQAAEAIPVPAEIVVVERGWHMLLRDLAAEDSYAAIESFIRRQRPAVPRAPGVHGAPPPAALRAPGPADS